jgi:hypothetical protein
MKKDLKDLYTSIERKFGLIIIGIVKGKENLVTIL